MNEGLAEGHKEIDQEADLIRRAKARSPEAWTEIYESSHPKLFRYVMARVGHQELAEDLTATVFVEAFKSIGGYSHRGRPLLAWLYRIARNVVSYHHRTEFRKNASQALRAAPARVLSQLLSTKRRLGSQPADAPSAGEAGELADPAAVAERLDLRQAIGHLSREQRDVIILRYFVGLTTPEVARVVGKHERAVYSLQTRAIKALRRHLR
jgi:RNA polymerase sigma-70 factor (ECF subfamily)